MPAVWFRTQMKVDVNVSTATQWVPRGKWQTAESTRESRKVAQSYNGKDADDCFQCGVE